MSTKHLKAQYVIDRSWTLYDCVQSQVYNGKTGKKGRYGEFDICERAKIRFYLPTKSMLYLGLQMTDALKVSNLAGNKYEI